MINGLPVHWGQRFRRFAEPRLARAASTLPYWLEPPLLVVVCWQIAGMLWAILSPSTADVSLAMPHHAPEDRGDGRGALARWYAAHSTSDGLRSDDFNLIAVIAADDGVALLKKSDGRALTVRPGQEIAPGNRVLAVQPDAIVVERNGTRERITLPRTGKLPPVVPAGSVGQTKSPETIILTRGRMTGVMEGANLAGWDKGLSSVADGGVRIEDAATHPLAQLLQLRSGDVLKRVNQRPLEQLGDLSLLLHVLGQETAAHLVFVRDGAQVTRHYEIRP